MFFVDRCLGRKTVPEALRFALELGERVETHDAHFDPDARDVDWLSAVGKRGWVVLSQDQRISRNPLEQRALLGANVAFFGVGAANAPGAEIAAVLERALPAIRRALRRFRLPMIASVTLKSDVNVKWNDGVRTPEPIRIAAPKYPAKTSGEK